MTISPDLINEPEASRESYTEKQPLNLPLPPAPFRWGFVLDLLLILVLLLGAYLRFSGLAWDEYSFMHPDERFLVMVGSSITPVQNLAEYFNTSVSSLNPHNRGYGFYVYGTFPLFLTRYITEWVSKGGGLREIVNVGRPLSAFFDLLTVLMVYLAGAKAYGKRVGLLGAAFLAVAVLPIQLSHFFKEDTFLNFFTMLAIYFSLRILLDRGAGTQHMTPSAEDPSNPDSVLSIEERFPSYALFAGFGISLGLAVACKLNTAPVALLLPAALYLRLGRIPAPDEKPLWTKILLSLAGAALISLLIFRIFQPYAFSGPGFFDIKPNPLWVDNIREQRAQADGDVDFPPAMQWARRSIWFAGDNLIRWGLGLPLGILAAAGFLWIGASLFRKAVLPDKREDDLGPGQSHESWKQDLLLWGWVAFYFIWQSSSFNPTMRYLLPIYPLLALFAAWAVFKLWDLGVQFKRPVLRPIALILGGAVFLATTVYAFGFLKIYTTPFTRVEASRWIYQNIPGPLNLRIQTKEGLVNQPLSFPYDRTFDRSMPYAEPFVPVVSGTLQEVYAGSILDLEKIPEEKTLTLTIFDSANLNEPLASAIVHSNFLAGDGTVLRGYPFRLNHPVNVEKERTYTLTLRLDGNGGVIKLAGAAIANEGDWDDSLPLRIDNYDAFGGIYPGDLSFNMYWDDNEEKLARFENILNRTEYIIISSNRQWGTLPRIPERFPLVTAYYRTLLGCPAEKTIEWCYRVAKPGTYKGQLGFDLVQVFQSDPRLAGFSVNDQFAEEAFTVYDHPKVLIFRKNASYQSARMEEILRSVDLKNVVHVTPKRAGTRPMDLLLPPERLSEQRSGGTWSAFFNPEALQNRVEVVGVLFWYVFLLLLGLLVYPFTRLAFRGLDDRGYPLSRMLGLLLLAFLVWSAGSARIPFERVTITASLALMAAIGGGLAWVQRAEIREEWHSQKKQVLLIEALALIAFLLVLFIRWGNPDLWHPWKGGEKPMDFSYLNAVIKSTSFPPYDPWFAGGYLNYYYYGFVIMAVPIKLLGIVPSFAYNLILPTVFSLIVLGAFCIGSNFRRQMKWMIGIAAALGVALLGNLGTWRMIFRGFQMLAAPEGKAQELSNSLIDVFQHWGWAMNGFVKVLGGDSLPYGGADWYWNPSRAIAALGDVEPITEFPFFTILYGDPHAHLFAIPVALLALAWVIGVVKEHGWRENPHLPWKLHLICMACSLFAGGLAIGALRPTNTWDFPTYLLLGVLACLYAIVQGRRNRDILTSLPSLWQTVLDALTPVALLALSFVLYSPFAAWFGQGYTAIEVWKGPRTPLSDYLTHWGLFLFLIVSWLIVESIQWMASTPLSHLRKLAPYRGIIIAILILSTAVMIVLGLSLPPSDSLIKLPFDVGFLFFSNVQVAWLVIPLGIWVIALLLRPGQSEEKRVVLFLTGSGLALTLFVELFVLKGDIGRMNTVFKFYLQTWVFFAVSAAAALGWTLDVSRSSISAGGYPKNISWVPFWQTGFIILACAAALYPALAAPAKIRDRMVQDAPHTLDGMDYMRYASYFDQDVEMDLSQDYRAIRWMQDNVKGSPVIVEGNTPEYRWGSRYTVYTGLPGVVGWNWHQRQQRGVVSNEWVTDRVAEIGQFYLTTDSESARLFLEKYDVSYIIVGQLERAYHPGAGLEKFETMNGLLWNEVYREGDTVIYQVIR